MKAGGQQPCRQNRSEDKTRGELKDSLQKRIQKARSNTSQGSVDQCFVHFNGILCDQNDQNDIKHTHGACGKPRAALHPDSPPAGKRADTNQKDKCSDQDRLHPDAHAQKCTFPLLQCKDIQSSHCQIQHLPVHHLPHHTIQWRGQLSLHLPQSIHFS